MSETAKLVEPEGSLGRVGVIRRIVPETPDSWTFWTTFRGGDGEGYAFEAGQFNMLYLYGIGEVPISISSDPAHPQNLGHTIRFVGRVTNAFKDLTPGDEIGIRGPYGKPWPLEAAEGGDLVVVAGGLGICPVRPAVESAMRHRDRYRRLVLLLGARSPDLFPYREELDRWLAQMERIGVEIHLSIDEPADGWLYNVGVVTTLFPKAGIEAARTTAFVCGPEIMMRFAGKGLLELGVPPERMYLSMERNMQCGIKLCGHCQVGPYFVCTDGPVFRYDEVADLMEVHDL
ncbi:MAG: FAD/NAD(P)-binding protein [Candidatus Velamenicoccus archaeovorus]